MGRSQAPVRNPPTRFTLRSIAKPSPPSPPLKQQRAVLAIVPACTPISSTLERAPHPSQTGPRGVRAAPIHFAALESRLHPPAGIVPRLLTAPLPPDRIGQTAGSPLQRPGSVPQMHSACRAAPLPLLAPYARQTNRNPLSPRDTCDPRRSIANESAGAILWQFRANRPGELLLDLRLRHSAPTPRIP